jgi:hypothetical protein
MERSTLLKASTSSLVAAFKDSISSLNSFLKDSMSPLVATSLSTAFIIASLTSGSDASSSASLHEDLYDLIGW